MVTHTVTWATQVAAESHEDAVRQAYEIARDPTRITTYYRSTLIARPSDSRTVGVTESDDDA